MPIFFPALRYCAPVLTALALGGCMGDRLTQFQAPEPASGAPPPGSAQPSAPPVDMAGRWLLTSPGRGQCYMTFRAASAAAGSGTIAPEGGCPGKFFTSRKWNYEHGSLVMRDHNGKPLAQLSAAGGVFNGQATSGEPVTLMR